MKRLLTIIVAMMTAATSGLIAQGELANPLEPAKGRPRIFIGPVGGYNRSLHSSGFQSVVGDVLCPDFQQGNANGYYFGFSGEYLLGKPAESKSSLIARIVYNAFPANYREPGDRLPSIAPDNSIVYSSVEHVAEINYGIVDLEVVYKLNLFNSNFGVVIGPTVGIPVSTTIEQRMELVEPLNARFDKVLVPDGIYTNNDRAIILRPEGEIEDRAGVRVAVKAGAQYEIPVGRLLLVPCVYYNFGITEVSPANNLRINALQMGVDLRFAI
ncbi:MAG: hypothetical protein MUC47_05625 [Candidatus Kapabacteria bacterium]|jgi:hypothetical protein|nr:hypothetical protein [Candidatus Kapabacteria bacterium]